MAQTKEQNRISAAVCDAKKVSAGLIKVGKYIVNTPEAKRALTRAANRINAKYGKGLISER